ncbi:MAG: class I SAM-dependent methyltransferase [Candidatus Hodarchaeales archaeon]
MDRKENFFIKSPFKKLMQAFFEFRVFKWFLHLENIDLTGKRMVEAGCGSGYGLKLIHDQFKPNELVAFDLMPEMVIRSRHLISRNKIPAKIFIGNITETRLPRGKYDCVVIFTVLHHVPLWREAIMEMSRLLKPGGYLLVNEHDKISLDRLERFFRVYHPEKSRFFWSEFKEKLKEAGFRVLREKRFFLGVGLDFFLCQKIAK